MKVYFFSVRTRNDQIKKKTIRVVDSLVSIDEEDLKKCPRFQLLLKLCETEEEKEKLLSTDEYKKSLSKIINYIKFIGIRSKFNLDMTVHKIICEFEVTEQDIELVINNDDNIFFDSIIKV